MDGLPLDDHAPALYTIGQVADMLDVQPAFLRRLEAQEIVQPARSPGGQRRYSRNEIAEIRHVTELTGEGLTLAGIRRILLLEADLAALRMELERERSARRRRR
jgi:MerR family transcriptional regulator/heat shock protein HspR